MYTTLIQMAMLVVGMAAVVITETKMRQRQQQYRNQPRDSPPQRSDDNCAICWLSLCSGNIFHTTCNHQFHYNCFIRWQREGRNCPLCRSKITIS